MQNRTETYWNGRNWRPILKLKTVEDACKTTLLSIRGKVDSKARRGKMREWVCWARGKNGGNERQGGSLNITWFLTEQETS